MRRIAGALIYRDRLGADVVALQKVNGPKAASLHAAVPELYPEEIKKMKFQRGNLWLV